MSERFAPDFTKVDASIPIYTKGVYQVLVKEATPFVFNNRNDQLRVGVRYKLGMVGQFDSKGKLDRSDEGRPMSTVSLWLHSEKAWGMGKQFLMAAAGYQRADENKANTDFFGKYEWQVEGDPGDEVEDLVMGNGYAALQGKAVNVNLDEQTRTLDDGSERTDQDFKNWSPA